MHHALNSLAAYIYENITLMRPDWKSHLCQRRNQIIDEPAIEVLEGDGFGSLTVLLYADAVFIRDEGDDLCQGDAQAFRSGCEGYVFIGYPKQPGTDGAHFVHLDRIAPECARTVIHALHNAHAEAG